MGELRTNTDFLRWVNGASFYLGYVSYSTLFPGAMLCAISSDKDDDLGKLVDDIGTRGDMVAIDAAEKIMEKVYADEWWVGSDDNPALAVNKALNAIRRHYYQELHNQAAPAPSSPTLSG